MKSHIAFFLLYLVSIIRIIVGFVPFVVPSFAVKRMKLPIGHDNASYRSMFRLFGVRDIVLGAMTILYYPIETSLVYLLLLNAFVDGGDVLSAIVAYRSGNEMKNSAKQSIIVASLACLAWILAIYFEGTAS